MSLNRYPDWSGHDTRLVPKDQTAWFQVNHMHLYNANPNINDTNDVRNGIRLRADLHHGLEHPVFVPYPSEIFVAVFIQRGSP